ncbi:cytochrome-c peroxidase [Amantichitinum ursilacus]|uniref:Methylamine utilization protein MauG n=1 Tax=Amantichitinum ursilacus TaxID=857265 RepID=A0A0N0GLI5_9NEIS|nr:cytochrome c peroxidase [Amantichitinum ursilacus]KPC49926.1 Methylamine utilization protein MauG precursor [Amantichitinum ursilacus]
MPRFTKPQSRLFFPVFSCAALLALGALYGGKDSLAATPAARSASATAKKEPAWKSSDYAPVKNQPSYKELAAVGKLMFFDPSLSASGKMACATCHSPDHAFGPPNNLQVQLGGRDGKLEGTRAVPSLRYLQTVPVFTEHFYDDDGDDSVDAGPTGGHNWDGRARNVHEQARIPLLAVNEMANASPAEVAAKLQKAAYAPQLRKLLGDEIFNNPDQLFKWGTLALEDYQDTPADFYPYSSKYDAFLRHQTQLTKQELHGLEVFNDEEKGNCASCHISAVTPEGIFPNFSDFGLLAIGVPRNMKLAINQNSKFNDMGACGPDRTDLKGRGEFCGLFRTPSLRNVATRKVFFHNGAFNDLEKVVHFYNERETNPGKWYAKDSHGKVIKYDDLPKQYVENINMEAPFNHKRGDKPPMTDAEIRDVVAFMKTLTDGYTDPIQQGGKIRTAKAQ